MMNKPTTQSKCKKIVQKVKQILFYIFIQLAFWNIVVMTLTMLIYNFYHTPTIKFLKSLYNLCNLRNLCIGNFTFKKLSPKFDLKSFILTCKKGFFMEKCLNLPNFEGNFFKLPNFKERHPNDIICIIGYSRQPMISKDSYK